VATWTMGKVLRADGAPAVRFARAWWSRRCACPAAMRSSTRPTCTRRA